MIGNLIVPPWARIAVPALIAIAIFFGGFKVATWKWSGRVEKAVAAKEKAEKIAREKVALEAQWRQDIKDITADLVAKAAAYQKLEDDYLEATSRPPEVVIEIREKIKTVTEVIVSEDCRQGVSELFTFISELPDRPQ